MAYTPPSVAKRNAAARKRVHDAIVAEKKAKAASAMAAVAAASKKAGK